MRDRTGERGHLMVGLMAAVAVMAIVSTVAFQAWADVIRRDREAEMMFRGQEIARALKKYQKVQGAYPTELKKLMDKLSTNQYVLRRLYTDPLVKNGKWGLLFITPDGGIYDPNGEQDEGAVDASGKPVGGEPKPFGMSSMGSGSNPGQQGAGKAKGTSAFGQMGASGGAQEGMPIVGVRTLCADKPFRVFRDQTEYSKWLFTALDNDDLPPAPGQPVPLGGQKPNGGNNPGGNGTNNGGIGNNPGGTGINNGGTGNNPGGIGGTKPPGGGTLGITPVGGGKAPQPDGKN